MKHHLLLRFFALVVAISCALNSSAISFEVDGIYYATGTLFSTGSNSVSVISKSSNQNSYSGSVVIPETVTYKGVTYNVRGIDPFAFGNCTGLTSVTIPNSVTNIGWGAFDGCTILTKVIIKDGDYTLNFYMTNQANPTIFYNCPLTTLQIGRNLSYTNTQGLSPFKNMTTLKTVTFSNNVTTISENVFRGCTGLTSVTIPNSVTSIGSSAFAGCTRLTAIQIPNSVTSIGGGAFESCTALTSINIPNSVVSIGTRVFCNCKKMTSITIPNSVKYLGYESFSLCSGLASINIPNSVTIIDDYAFADCTSLKNITLEDGNKVLVIGSSDYWYDNSHAYPITHIFTNCPIQKLHLGRDLTFDDGAHIGYTLYPFAEKNTLETVTIGDSVTSIAESLFSNCARLSKVTIGNSVKTIGKSAFHHCNGLLTVTLGQSVTTIGSYAFYYCSKLKNITFPKSLTEIGDLAFDNIGFTFIHCLASTPPKIYSNTFSKYDANLSVPTISISSYESHQYWKNFSIVLYDLTSDGIYYRINDDYTASVSCINTNYNSYSGVVAIPETITYNGSVYQVTAIGDNAFRGSIGLTNVYIPNTVTRIGNNAFKDCI